MWLLPERSKVLLSTLRNPNLLDDYRCPVVHEGIGTFGSLFDEERLRQLCYAFPRRWVLTKISRELWTER